MICYIIKCSASYEGHTSLLVTYQLSWYVIKQFVTQAVLMNLHYSSGVEDGEVWRVSGTFFGSAKGIAGADEVMLLGGSDPLFVPIGTFSILGNEFDDTIPLGGVGELGV